MSSMKAGRKNLKQVSKEHGFSLEEGQTVMQVVSLRGSNLIEVVDAEGVKSLALFPAKFQKSFWIKRGSFVVVDGSGREKALESGSKIACIVSQALYHDQVRTLKKSSEWLSSFTTTSVDDSIAKEQQSKLGKEERSKSEKEESSSSDEDDLPPLEPNLNRPRPVELSSDSDSGSGTDSAS